MIVAALLVFFLYACGCALMRAYAKAVAPSAADSLWVIMLWPAHVVVAIAESIYEGDFKW